MEIPASKENRILASSVNSRIRSDARLNYARASLWRLLGIGTLCALGGVGIGAAFYGYSYVRDPTMDAELIARAVAKGLANASVKVEGSVGIDPASLAQLAPRPPDVPRPSASQLGTDTQPASRAAVATNFTVFKNVGFGSGQVVTGWNFSSGEQATPEHQYCYYSEQLDGTSKVTIDLGENGRPLPQTRTRPNVDTGKAYTSCVWFKSGSL